VRTSGVFQGRIRGSARPLKPARRCVKRHCGASHTKRYIGESTSREIAYAVATGKRIRLLEGDGDGEGWAQHHYERWKDDPLLKEALP
jgi:hypothetical protein